jgi:uncharacterized DUF497 family protein
MAQYRWDLAKNDKLIEQRGISFEEVVFCLETGCLLDVIGNPNEKRYGHQRMFVLEINGYVYVVPFVDNGGEIFFKTIIPSRKFTKKYLRG